MGDVSTTSTSTAGWPNQSQRNDALTLWNDYIDSFYGIAPTATSPGYKGSSQRLAEDTAHLKIGDEAYNTKMAALDTATKTAMSPYQQQLQSMLTQSGDKSGYFTPVSFGFGGKKMAEFVPKANRDLANQLLGIGKEKTQFDTGIVDLDRQAAARDLALNTTYTPNKVGNDYDKALRELMWMLNSGQQTQTQSASANLPEQSTYSKVLQGITAGSNLANAIYPWQKSGGSVIDSLANLFSPNSSSTSNSNSINDNSSWLDDYLFDNYDYGEYNDWNL
jgi:hypothetical protein